MEIIPRQLSVWSVPGSKLRESIFCILIVLPSNRLIIHYANTILYSKHDRLKANIPRSDVLLHYVCIHCTWTML